MTFRLERDVYCHDIRHPPKERRGSDINLTLTGSNNLITLERHPSFKETSAEKVFETQYSIHIPDAKLVGFTEDDEGIANLEFKNLLLAFNLLLSRVCIMGRRTSFTGSSIRPNIPESKYRVEKKGNMNIVHLQDSTIIKDSTFVTIGIGESIEEKEVIHLFNKLQRFKRFNINTTRRLQEVNLSRSFSEYEDAMSNFEILSKFKHLFNALEYSTNIDGEDRRGARFDNFVTSLVATPNTEVEEWRDLYNRIKHPEEYLDDIINYLDGIQKLGEYTLAIRKSCRELLLLRLT